MKVIGGRGVLTQPIHETILRIGGITFTSDVDVFGELPRAIESIACFQRRPIRRIAGPVGIDFPSLKRAEAHGPLSRVVSITPVEGTKSIARAVIAPTLPLVVVRVTCALVIIVRPGSAVPA